MIHHWEPTPLFGAGCERASFDPRDRDMGIVDRCDECEGILVDGECTGRCAESPCPVDGCDGTLASKAAADADDDLTAGACRECGRRDGDCAACGKQICRCATEDVVTCDVSPELADLFTVTLKSGRVFRGCGIQGSGGSLRGRDSCVRAQQMRVKNTTLRIITRDRAGDHAFADVRTIDVFTIARVRA